MEYNKRNAYNTFKFVKLLNVSDLIEAILL